MKTATKTPTMKKVLEHVCASQAEKTLFAAVMRQMTPSWQEVWDYTEDYRDASGGVGGFIYYGDTEPWAKRHAAAIMTVLNDFEREMGEPLKKDEDSLWNWYAWFALEHTIQLVLDYKEGGL